MQSRILLLMTLQSAELLKANNKELNAAEQHVIEVARYDYKITQGVTIATISKPHYIAGASIVSEDSSAEFAALLDERLHLLNTLVKLFHHRIHEDFGFRKAFYLPLLEQLNPRERQVLKFTITGLPLKVIEQYYPLSATAAANIRSELFKKFGVKNSSQLAYIAGLHDLISILDA